MAKHQPECNINMYHNTQINIPDLNNYTVVKIKEWAVSNGLKVPSGLKKAELIQYLTGKITEKSQGIIPEIKPTTFPIEILQPRIPDPNLDWLVHLHKHGWSVVSIPNWNPDFTQMFFDWLEGCNQNFKRGDFNTWKTSNMPNMSHGIFKHYFGHTEFQWRIRELCAPIFANIWGCQEEDLLSSYDGGCFLVPSSKNKSFKQWIHVDQPNQYRTFCSVQGIVNFEENGPEDGGLVLVEGSHLIFNEYMDKHPSEGIVWGPSDITDPLLSTRPLIKICAPPGSIILFDTRTFHCNVHPWGSPLKMDGSLRFRMCTYVSMQPRSGATQKELDKRIKLYEKGRMTGHWCYGQWFKETPENPHLYGGENVRPQTIEIAPLNPLRSRLIGY